jgi:hypothetical protein
MEILKIKNRIRFLKKRKLFILSMWKLTLDYYGNGGGKKTLIDNNNNNKFNN